MGQGGRPPDVSDEEVVAAVQQALTDSGDPVVSTKEVGANLSINAENVVPRLKSLMDEDRVRGKQAGASYVWWLPD